MKKDKFIQRLKANFYAKRAFINICRNSKLHHSVQGRKIDDILESQIKNLRKKKDDGPSSKQLPLIQSSSKRLKNYSKNIPKKKIRKNKPDLEYNISVGFISREENFLREKLKNKVVFNKDIQKMVQRKTEKNAYVSKITGKKPSQFQAWDSFFKKRDFELSSQVNNPKFRNRLSPNQLKHYGRLNPPPGLIKNKSLDNSLDISRRGKRDFKIQASNSLSTDKTVRRNNNFSITSKKSMGDKTIIQMDKLIDLSYNSNKEQKCMKKYRRKGSMPLQSLKHRAMYGGCKISRLVSVERHLSMMEKKKKKIEEKMKDEINLAESNLKRKLEQTFTFNIHNMSELSEQRSKEIFENSAPLRLYQAYGLNIKKKNKSKKYDINASMLKEDVDKIIKINNSLDSANRDLDNGEYENSINRPSITGDLVKLCHTTSGNASKLLNRKLSSLRKNQRENKKKRYPNRRRNPLAKKQEVLKKMKRSRLRKQAYNKRKERNDKSNI